MFNVSSYEIGKNFCTIEHSLIEFERQWRLITESSYLHNAAEETAVAQYSDSLLLNSCSWIKGVNSLTADC